METEETVIEMATHIGTIGEYIPEKEDFFMYKKRLEVWMKVNKIKADEKASVFLALVGPHAFEIVTNMCTPEDPMNKSYEELVKIAEDHFRVSRNPVTERVVFRERKQKPGESISKYIVELKMLSRHCNYGDQLAENLRDAFVSGLTELSIRRKLLSIKDLTWDTAQQEALSWEAAQRDAQYGTNVEAKKETVSQVKKVQYQQKPKQLCGRCLGNHPEDKCPHKRDRCYSCNKYGHIGKACRMKKDGKLNKKNVNLKAKAHMVKSVPESEYLVPKDTEQGVLANLWAVKGPPTPELTETLLIDDVPTTFVVDTAATVSVMGEVQYRTILAHRELHESRVVLQSYSGAYLDVLGEITIKVCYRGNTYELPLVIVKGRKPALLGRNWMKSLRLNWKEILKTFSVKTSTKLEEVINSYRAVFSEKSELHVIQNHEAVIKVRPDSSPIFMKARLVPYALRDKVAQQIDKLVKTGVLKPVSQSDWAAPIVVAPKADGNIRICGDYKVTVNKCVIDETYPLPTPEDLFSTLSGGAVFTKLDLSSAYQQLKLSEESKKLLTINTHKGLYQYQRLPFGVSTAPSIFQAVMDQILKGIDGVVCYLDDILISSKDMESHLNTVKQVLNRLKEHEILVKQTKCEFGVREVEYLGHKVSEAGLQCTNEKIEAIQNAPKPQNVSELRTYLGMVTYYQKFIPNLADKFAPLYKLLKSECEWNWTDECDKAVNEVKECLTSEHVLVHYDGKLPITLATDASPQGIGAVISHIVNGQERPIAFA